jgi:hypothetical protein
MERAVHSWRGIVKRLAAALIVTLVSGASSMAEVREGHEIDVNVAAKSVGGSWGLEFIVTNHASNAIAIARESLPWLCPRSLLVLAEEYRLRRVSNPLPNHSGHDSECPKGSYGIEPGGSASGFVELREHIDRLGEELRDGDVAIFWFWRFAVEGRPKEENHGGYEIIRTRSDEGRGSAATDATGLPSIMVNAFPMDDYEPAALGFVLRNDGSKATSIAFTELPWLSLTRVIVRAGLLNPPRPIAEVGSAERHVRGPTAWVTLPPGSYMTGEMPLYKRFDGLDELLKGHDVVIFWLYSGRSTDDAEIGPRGGFALFPKRR